MGAVTLLWIAVVVLALVGIFLLAQCLLLRGRLAIAVREREFYIGLAVRLREASEARPSPEAERWVATIRPAPEPES